MAEQGTIAPPPNWRYIWYTAMGKPMAESARHALWVRFWNLRTRSALRANSARKEDHALRVEKPALYPAEFARGEVCVFGVEQATRNGAEGYEEREEHRPAPNECINFLTPASLTEGCEDYYKKKYYDNIGCDSAKRENVCNELDEGCHEEIISQRTAGFLRECLWCLHAYEARAIAKDPRWILDHVVVDAYLCLSGSAGERALNIGKVLSARAELCFLFCAMRAPERAVERGAALCNTFCKRVILMWRRRQALDIYKNGECGRDHKDDPCCDPHLPQSALLLFRDVIHKNVPSS